MKKTLVKEFVSAVQRITDVSPLLVKFVIVKGTGADAHRIGVKEKVSAVQKAIRCANRFGRSGISMGDLYKPEFNPPQFQSNGDWNRRLKAKG